jgi:putative oxidoreductase
MLMNRILQTKAPAITLLIRLMVGAVFLSEGVQKLMSPDELGAGRFLHIGIPAPAVMAPFVAVVEIIGGGLVILGLFTRPAALLLLINISVAILSTKVPILLGRGLWTFSLPRLAHYGFWSMAHEARTDFCMWLGSLSLLIGGAGWLSFDAVLSRRRGSETGIQSPD